MVSRQSESRRAEGRLSGPHHGPAPVPQPRRPRGVALLRLGVLRSLQRRVFGIEEGEAACVLWAAATFFCALSGYYVLRPLRDAFGIAEGLRNLKWLYLLTFVVMLVASPVFALLVARFPRRRVVPWICHFFALNLALFSALLHFLPDELRGRVGSVFFSWTSVYNLIVVSVGNRSMT